MVQIAVLEEQKNEVTEIEEDDKVEEEQQKKEIEQDASAAELSEKRAQVEEKPDMNDVPMEDNQVKRSASFFYQPKPKLMSSPSRDFACFFLLIIGFWNHLLKRVYTSFLLVGLLKDLHLTIIAAN